MTKRLEKLKDLLLSLSIDLILISKEILFYEDKMNAVSDIIKGLILEKTNSYAIKQRELQRLFKKETFFQDLIFGCQQKLELVNFKLKEVNKMLDEEKAFE